MLFTELMIKAIVHDRKSQTRRLVKEGEIGLLGNVKLDYITLAAKKLELVGKADIIEVRKGEKWDSKSKRMDEAWLAEIAAGTAPQVRKRNGEIIHLCPKHTEVFLKQFPPQYPIVEI